MRSYSIHNYPTLSLTSVREYESKDTLKTIFILHGPWHNTKHHGCKFESKCLFLKVRGQHEDLQTYCLPIKSLPFRTQTIMLNKAKKRQFIRLISITDSTILMCFKERVFHFQSCHSHSQEKGARFSS